MAAKRFQIGYSEQRKLAALAEETAIKYNMGSQRDDAKPSERAMAAVEAERWQEIADGIKSSLHIDIVPLP